MHAKKPEDINTDLLKDVKNVVLVDSVVNSGKSVVEFLDWLLPEVEGGEVGKFGEVLVCSRVKGPIKIVVVTGVVQAGAVKLLEQWCQGRQVLVDRGPGLVEELKDEQESDKEQEQENEQGQESEEQPDIEQKQETALEHEHEVTVTVDVVALRQSQNKYTGTGGTDTGHRLFGTTQLN